MHTVGYLAKLFGLSRSTLLYYDEIGLLSPSARNAANYRLYSDGDVQRMERIAIYREAGLPLETIRQLLLDESDSVSAALERHLIGLNEEIAKLRKQQHVIARLLGDARVLRGSRSLTKTQWVDLLASAGMNEDGMSAWHAEFEKNFPQAHQDFLESLGIPKEEVDMIRRFSSGK